MNYKLERSEYLLHMTNSINTIIDTKNLFYWINLFFFYAYIFLFLSLRSI